MKHFSLLSLAALVMLELTPRPATAITGGELDALTAENVTGNTALTSSPDIAGSYRRLR